jgi:hypothetical protein
MDQVLIDMRWHSSIFDVRSLRGDDWDTDYHPVVVKVRERLSVSKQAAHEFGVEIFSLKKLRDVDVMEQYQ